MPGGNGECENRVCTGTRGEAHKLDMKNGLPYLSKELFWKATQDISTQAKLISGLMDRVEGRDRETSAGNPTSNLLGAGSEVSTIPLVVFSCLAPSDHFSPKKARRVVMTRL